MFRLHAPDGSEFLFGADSEEQQEEWKWNGRREEADFQSVALIPKKGVWKRKTEKDKKEITVIRHLRE